MTFPKNKFRLMKTLFLITALAVSSLGYSQVSLPYYEDFDDVDAAGWTLLVPETWHLWNLSGGNWVLRSKKETDGNGYYHIFSPTFHTGNAVAPRFRCEAKFDRMDNSWNCAPQLSVVVENLDNSQEVTFEYGSDADVCSGEDVSVGDNTLFPVSRPLPLNANVRIRIIANFFDPGWLYIDNVEVIDLNASSVEETLPISAITVYPSPATDMAIVSFTLVQFETFKIEVFNELGQVLWQNTVTGLPGTHKESIDISSFASGMYYVHLSNESFNVSHKLVKQ